MLRESATAPFREKPQPMYVRGAETGVVIFAPADDLTAAAALKQQLEPVAVRSELASDEKPEGSVVVRSPMIRAPTSRPSETGTVLVGRRRPFVPGLGGSS